MRLIRTAKRASITLRLTALFAAASTVVLLLLGFLIGGAVEQHFVEQDMEVLTGKLELTRHALEKVRSERDMVAIPGQLDDSLVGHRGLAVVVVAPDGQNLFATRDADFPQRLLEGKVLAEPPQPLTFESERKIPFRGIVASARTGIAGAGPAVVAVATDISHHEQFMHSFRSTLWTFVVLAALVSGLLGWVAVRRGLAPLQALRQKAAGVTAQKLDARLDVAVVPLELVPLAETFNAMLSRLENSFRRLSDFSSDLAHEFRTPISNLMTQTQVTLSQPRTPEAYRDVLASNVEEFERLAQMIADMLFIAKADEGQIVPCRENVALGRLVDELVEFYRMATDEKGICLSSSGSAQIVADAPMLRRALSNLIANAVRHTPSGGRITVRTQNSGQGAVTLAVENSGETIAPQHLARLFDRFYRADASRQRLSEGAGLGLAITQSIVHAHGGSVAVRSHAGVTVFELVLPAQEQRLISW